MRKGKMRLLTVLGTILLSAISPAVSVKAETALDVARKKGHKLEARYQPAGSIISEINTGQILWQENPQKEWQPASMSKLIVILLAYDAMKEGKFTEETNVEVTQKYLDIAGRYSLSNNKMKAGVSYTVSELIDLIVVPSSAAATFMLADLIEPDPDKLSALMNQRAQSIGMAQTKYYNCIGVPNELLVPYNPPSQALTDCNVTTPQDYALLCSYFIKQYPEFLNHTKSPKIVVKEGTPYEERFDSYQISLEGAKYGLKGTDGIKTGSNQFGFNYSSTAKQGDTRLVEIIMGVSTWEDQTGEEVRHIVGNAIMEQAFEKFEYRKVLPKGTHKIGKEKIVTKKDLWDCVPKGEEAPLVLKNGKVMVNLERSYLPGYEAPQVSYQKASLFGDGKAGSPEKKEGTSAKSIVITLIAGTMILFICATAGLIGYLYIKKEQKRRRRARRREQIRKKRQQPLQ